DGAEWRAPQPSLNSRTPMTLLLGVLLGAGLAAIIVAAWRGFRHDRVSDTPEAAGMQSALHAATSTLPHLRRGLTGRTAEIAVPHLRALTGAAAIALADTRAVLAIDGEGREQVRPGDLLSRLLARTPDNRMHIEPRLVSSDPSCPLRSAVLAPLVVQGKRAGTLIAFYRAIGRPSNAELRVVQEAASLVSAQVELSVVADQERRLAQAELRALRAQISPHFIYNALAAVAGEIHERPEEARELLIDFAQFTRYLFRDGRSYVALGEEIEHVERRVHDDGAGIEPERVPAVLAGAGGGIGLSNVDARLRASFGERYALRIDSRVGVGTTAILTVPNLQAEPDRPQLAEPAAR